MASPTVDSAGAIGCFPFSFAQCWPSHVWRESLEMRANKL